MRRICDDVLLPFIKVQRQALPMIDGIAAADAWASIPNVSLDMFEEFVAPYIKTLNKSVGDPSFHIGGVGYWGESYIKDPVDFMKTKIRLTPEDYPSIQCGDPDIERLGPKIFKDTAEEQGVNLDFGIDAKLIHSGPVEAIIERVKQYIRVGAPGGRFTMSLPCIPATTPAEHVHAAVAAVRAYGRYPLPEDMDGIKIEVPERESFGEFIRRKQGSNPEGYTFSWLKESALY